MPQSGQADGITSQEWQIIVTSTTESSRASKWSLGGSFHGINDLHFFFFKSLI